MKLGIIGCGAMGSAIIGGIIAAGSVPAGDIIGSARSEAGRARAAEKLGIEMTASNVSVVSASDVVFIGVEPGQVPGVIQEIRDARKPGQIFISFASGVTLAAIASAFGPEASDVKVVRIMPNTPAQVREGMTAVCPNANISEEDLDLVRGLLESFGRAELLPEKLINAFVGVSGSSPAYVYMFIEALADGAVHEGMPRAAAYEFAAQAVLGSAKMVLESGLAPGVLKDQVCSPGGTTIEAVRVLEEKGFRSAVIEAVRACTEKADGKR